MKTRIISKGLIIVLFSFFSIPLFAQTAEVKIKTSAQCDECKERIEKALAAEKGIKKSDLNLDDQVITVVYYDKRIAPEKIREIISKSGYDADDVAAQKEAYDKLPKCCKKGGH